MSVSGTATVTLPNFTRSNFSAETKVYPIRLTSLKVWDALQTNLPATASSDDAAIVTGTPGTDAPTLQGQDSGGATTTAKFAREYSLPPEFVSGGPLYIRVKGAMLTTIADASATIDFSVYKDARTGSVGSDLVTTTAQTINNLTALQYDFVIDATSLEAGDKLIIVGTMSVEDSGNAGVMIPEVQALEVVASVQG